LTAVIFDIVHLITGNGYWSGLAFWMIGVGIVGGLLSALTGALDWTGIPRKSNAKLVGMVHGIGNSIVLTLFLVSWLLRLTAPEHPSLLAYILAFLGAALLNATGWLGGELTGRYGVGIEEGAHINAPGGLIKASPQSIRSDVL
jgi:uncharacterized membrane protein